MKEVGSGDFCLSALESEQSSGLFFPFGDGFTLQHRLSKHNDELLL